MLKVLVFVPHPDDEVLGCGGTIARHSRNGGEVYLCVVTKAYAPDWSEEFLKNRPKEVKKVGKILGVKKTYFLDFPTAKLDGVSHKALNDAILKVVNEVKPDTVYLPHIGDVSKDHRLIFESAMVALRPKPDLSVRRVLSCEIPSETEWGLGMFAPNVYIDISDTLGAKLEAMGVYKTENREYPHPRSLEGIMALARRRGTEVGVSAAEAFMLLREVS